MGCIVGHSDVGCPTVTVRDDVEQPTGSRASGVGASHGDDADASDYSSVDDRRRSQVAGRRLVALHVNARRESDPAASDVRRSRSKRVGAGLDIDFVAGSDCHTRRFPRRGVGVPFRAVARRVVAGGFDVNRGHAACKRKRGRLSHGPTTGSEGCASPRT